MGESWGRPEGGGEVSGVFQGGGDGKGMRGGTAVVLDADGD